MIQRNLIVSLALEQVGYQEGRNNSNKFSQFFGKDNQPWCADFIGWLKAYADVNGNKMPTSSLVQDFVRFYDKIGLFKDKDVYTPKPGDLIIYDFNHNDYADHIGIVVKVKNGQVYTVEGNTSKQGESGNGEYVAYKHRSLKYGGIWGYCTPEYDDDLREVQEEDMIRYDNLKQLPDWAYPTIAKLIKKGSLKGKGDGKLDLSEDMVRIFVINDNEGLYE